MKDVFSDLVGLYCVVLIWKEIMRDGATDVKAEEIKY